jgi:protein phosphatase
MTLLETALSRSRFSLDVGYATDVGKVRQRNEDSYAIHLPPKDTQKDTQRASRLRGMLLVADGMGGERGGDRASQMAAEGFHQCFVSGLFLTWPESLEADWPGPVLRRAIQEVNDEVFKLGEREPELQGLGTTVVLTVMTDEHMVIAHVGDSRCYRVRGRRIEQLTVDHTWVERQVAAGLLTPEAARQHPNRNILIRSLGDPTPPGGDVRVEALHDGDVYVLCSDGLTGGVRDEEILALVQREPDPQRLANELVNYANIVDGSDNTTVVIGRCRETTLAESLPEPRSSEGGS